MAGIWPDIPARSVLDPSMTDALTPFRRRHIIPPRLGNWDKRDEKIFSFDGDGFNPI
jgi:hypothetical protein